jgi:hypothetical protein
MCLLTKEFNKTLGSFKELLGVNALRDIDIDKGTGESVKVGHFGE